MIFTFALFALIFSAFSLKLTWPLLTYKRPEFNLSIFMQALTLLCIIIVFILACGVK